MELNNKRQPILNGYWLDLGSIHYLPAFTIQEFIFQARIEGTLDSVVILQENPPVFTIGRAGSRDNLLATPAELDRRGIEVLEVNRGGDITYHGPGQIIASPIFYLGDLDMNANQYLHSLEDILIEVLALYDIQAGKKPDYPGVWVGEAKIGAVGIAVRHGYTFHGLSLNVNLDLSPFELINPCGVPRMPVTSMANELGQNVSFNEVKDQLRRVISAKFETGFEDVTWEILRSRFTV